MWAESQIHLGNGSSIARRQTREDNRFCIEEIFVDWKKAECILAVKNREGLIMHFLAHKKDLKSSGNSAIVLRIEINNIVKNE